MSSADDDAAGYGKPPKGSRFQPGRSGNPKGRPKGIRNFSTDLFAELRELISIRENGRERKLTKQQAVVRALVAAAISGNVRATSTLFSLCSQSSDRQAGGETTAPSAAEDADIIEAFVERVRDRQLADDKKPPTLEKEGDRK